MISFEPVVRFCDCSLYGVRPGHFVVDDEDGVPEYDGGGNHCGIGQVDEHGGSPSGRNAHYPRSPLPF
ncbi:hypothetical protein KZX46_21770 (plasmid) [Polymorphobacter sp. PAMC 29334]|uniref:hypothetical protein n=1 Tax=Polymorphobacter sp. PAMC 29334 TaxID=2862331 RepID=UPI001C79289D|nr:hypothetical protein [Polymorphobacter sp. PAMC 29334]QYE37263.1 hypothetical protein KZX46_21770 [Polymorphobacter sp. PAMC 29334]